MPWLACYCLGLALAGCGERTREMHLSGETMGTFYRVALTRFGDDQISSERSLQQSVEQQLDQLNQLMSTYIPGSEINQWNRLQAGQCIEVSKPFMDVVQVATEVAEASDHAFNPLVAPLVNRWGFGPADDNFVFPAPAEIAQLLAYSAPEYLQIGGELQLCKSSIIQSSQAKMDLSAVAKGYAVDQLAALLERRGLQNYLVDIGGEIRVSGVNANGHKWRLAVEKPLQTVKTAHQVIHVSGVAVATSGDYRNFFEHGGQRYSHTIDPRTGYPVIHDLVSVTVIANLAAVADAWATALTVAGPEKALELAQKHQLAVYIIQRENNEQGQSGERLLSYYSDAFAPYLEP